MFKRVLLCLLAACLTIIAACAAPLDTVRNPPQTEIAPALAALGALPVFITDQVTDGRNLKLRGTIRNPYAETIEDIRLIYLDVAAGTPERILSHDLKIVK